MGRGPAHFGSPSMARPGTVALRVEGPRALLRDHGGLVAPKGRAERREGRSRSRRWMQVRGAHGGVTAALKDVQRSNDGVTGSSASAPTSSDPTTPPSRARRSVRFETSRGPASNGFSASSGRPGGTSGRPPTSVVEGDPELQRAIRFALFQLMASVGEDGETAVGARGLTGPGYRGHVFWDADVFVLPFLAATRPRAARALLEYRVRRLPAASRRRTPPGARERASRGSLPAADETSRPTARGSRAGPSRFAPASSRSTSSPTSPGESRCYLDWTGDGEFAAGPGRTILVETARYWASRIRLDRDGRGHIDGVIGPDEYHEPVDDNAFTNVMARWNLRRAADAVVSAPGAEVDEDEVVRWRSLADALVDGYDAATGLYEQFAGFFELEPLVIADRRPAPADRSRAPPRPRATHGVPRSSKQADV